MKTNLSVFITYQVILMLVSIIQVLLPDGCLWAWSQVHCFSVSVSSHPGFVLRTSFLSSWFTSLLPSRSDCSSLTSCSTQSHSYWLSIISESPRSNFSWQILWGTTQTPLQGGVWFVFGLDLNLSLRAAPGYIHKLRKLGRSSRESTEGGSWGALVPFTCYFFPQIESRRIAPLSCCQLQLPFSPQVCIPGADHTLNTILLTVLTACH